MTVYQVLDMLQQPLRDYWSRTATPLVAVLSNPGSTRYDEAGEEVRAVVDAFPNTFHFELDGIDSIPQALRMFAQARPAMVVINGGDGTIQATLSSIVNDRPFDVIPPVAILPGGKTNMIAEDLGVRGRPAKVLARLLSLVASGKLGEHVELRNVIEMDLGDGHAPRVGMFFGAAGIVRGMLWCRKKIYPLKLPNLMSHAIAIGALIGSFIGLRRSDSPIRSDPMRINVKGGGIMQGRYSIVVVTTLDKLLLGMRPYGREGNGGLKFSSIGYGPRAMLNALKGLVTGSFGRKTLPGVNTRRSDVIRFESRDPVTLDGEIFLPVAGHAVELRGEKSLAFVKL